MDEQIKTPIPTSTPTPTPWNETIAARMVELYQQGKSRTQIAETLNVEFDRQFNRTAVSGKLYRLGFKQTREQQTQEQVAKRNAMGQLVRIITGIRSQIKRITNTGTGCDFMDLEHKSCRWPLNDFDPQYQLRRFCGLDRVEGPSPYCAKHYKQAFNKRPPVHA